MNGFVMALFQRPQFSSARYKIQASIKGALIPIVYDLLPEKQKLLIIGFGFLLLYLPNQSVYCKTITIAWFRLP